MAHCTCDYYYSLNTFLVCLIMATWRQIQHTFFLYLNLFSELWPFSVHMSKREYLWRKGILKVNIQLQGQLWLVELSNIFLWETIYLKEFFHVVMLPAWPFTKVFFLCCWPEIQNGHHQSKLFYIGYYWNMNKQVDSAQLVHELPG